MPTSEEHQRLTNQGASWLRRNGFGVVATELTCFGNRERPDVLGFRSSCSAMIEVKVSRSDFLADHKKPERSSGGIGVYRFYLCPEGLISPNELPAKWGLLYSKGRTVNAVVKPRGNIWPASTSQPPEVEELFKEWRDFQHESDALAERSALYSIARRLVAKA
ncbi:hypothetical protein LCGC14_0282890 [marine sediment metagenome]|uniref:Uncharacterized protein n=1 Tax=marine sediment metagenome TaxID=412755 RepID=A0A0F9TVR5_9ZZZZ